jgi:hypothetical protein
MINQTGKSFLMFALFACGASQSARAALDILYVNRCVGGCSLQAGADDALNRKSSILSSSSTITEFPHGDAVFNASVSCVRSVLAPYDVNVVTSEPGVARREVVLAGHASQAGQPPGVRGVAPWHQGVPTDNAIAYAFAADIGASVDNLCWTTAQQFGLLYGLDLEFYCSDIMSYAAGCGVKTFTDFDAQCGAFSAQPNCDTPGAPATQNSAQRLGAVPGRNDVVFRGLFEVRGPSP